MKQWIIFLMIVLLPIQVIAGDILEIDIDNSIWPVWFHYGKIKNFSFVTQLAGNTEYDIMEGLVGAFLQIGKVSIELPIGLRFDLSQNPQISHYEGKIVAYGSMSKDIRFASQNVFRKGRVGYSNQLFLREQIIYRAFGIRLQEFVAGDDKFSPNLGPVLSHNFEKFNSEIQIFVGWNILDLDQRFLEVDLLLFSF